jgi:predicted amidohydrolase
MRAVQAVVVLVLGSTALVGHAAAQQPAATQARIQAAQVTGQAAARVAEAPPTEVTLGVAIHPNAVFLGSFNAGQGQRYYLFGSSASFADLVTYYRGVLKDKGELVFDAPAIHMFDTGRFREEAMAFPPSVTVKDYTWGGKGGYLNPVRGAQPARFPTIIQIVPATAGTP